MLVLLRDQLSRPGFTRVGSVSSKNGRERLLDVLYPRAFMHISALAKGLFCCFFVDSCDARRRLGTSATSEPAHAAVRALKPL